MGAILSECRFELVIPTCAVKAELLDPDSEFWPGVGGQGAVEIEDVDFASWRH